MDADTVYTIAIVLFGVAVGTVIINIILLWFNFKVYTKILKERRERHNSRRRREEREEDEW